MRVLPLIVGFALMAGPASADAPLANAAASCGGAVTRSVNGNQVRARSIETYRMGCANGKTVIRRFLEKVDRSRDCDRNSDRPPPNSGCGIGSFNCFRGDNTYCASPSSKSVSWKELVLKR